MKALSHLKSTLIQIWLALFFKEIAIADTHSLVSTLKMIPTSNIFSISSYTFATYFLFMQYNIFRTGCVPSIRGIWCMHNFGGTPFRSLYVYANMSLYSKDTHNVIVFSMES